MLQTIGKHLGAKLLYNDAQKIILEVFSNTAYHGHANRAKQEKYNARCRPRERIVKALVAKWCAIALRLNKGIGQVHQLAKNNRIEQGKTDVERCQHQYQHYQPFIWT